MSRRRRARSSLYQVDFVAALFGAFLLLWISKPTGGTSEPETAVVVMESNCSDGYSVLPQGAERCVDSEVLQFTDPSLKLEACTFKPVFHPGTFADRFEASWDHEGPLTDLAEFSLKSKVTGHEIAVNFSGLALVVTDEPGRRFRAVGYGPSTPPDQVRGISYAGMAYANACQKNVCPLNYFTVHDSYRNQKPVQNCKLRFYSRAWPQTCLTTKEDFRTGGAGTAFDLEPCSK